MLAYELANTENVAEWLDSMADEWDEFSNWHLRAVRRLLHEIWQMKFLVIQSRPDEWACHRYHEHNTQEEKEECKDHFDPNSMLARESDRYSEHYQSTRGVGGVAAGPNTI